MPTKKPTNDDRVTQRPHTVTTCEFRHGPCRAIVANNAVRALPSRLNNFLCFDEALRKHIPGESLSPETTEQEAEEFWFETDAPCTSEISQWLEFRGIQRMLATSLCVRKTWELRMGSSDFEVQTWEFWLRDSNLELRLRSSDLEVQNGKFWLRVPNSWFTPRSSDSVVLTFTLRSSGVWKEMSRKNKLKNRLSYWRFFVLKFSLLFMAALFGRASRETTDSVQRLLRLLRLLGLLRLLSTGKSSVVSRRTSEY